MELSLETILAIVKIVEKVFLTAKSVLCDDRTGLYFCLADRHTGKPLIIAEIGKVSDEKISKYLEFSQEKAQRLYICSPSHSTSWQSRNEKENKWGGAIATQNFIFSCSGLPELIDEAVMLVSAVHSGHLNEEDAFEMASISSPGNASEFYGELMGLYRLDLDHAGK